jgi:hypothetical protein
LYAAVQISTSLDVDPRNFVIDGRMKMDSPLRRLSRAITPFAPA